MSRHIYKPAHNVYCVYVLFLKVGCVYVASKFSKLNNRLKVGPPLLNCCFQIHHHSASFLQPVFPAVRDVDQLSGVGAAHSCNDQSKAHASPFVSSCRGPCNSLCCGKWVMVVIETLRYACIAEPICITLLIQSFFHESDRTWKWPQIQLIFFHAGGSGNFLGDHAQCHIVSGPSWKFKEQGA